RAAETNCITLLEGFHAIELAMEGGRVSGIFARSGIGSDARLILFRARAVILATGGLGALYAVTTNPLEARGEGLGMAARAGAIIADPEFVQFHPTAIDVGRDPAPLATEALRGEGAVLVNSQGMRFMTAIHKDAELAPRDIVARAIHRQIVSGEKVFLDCRDTIGAQFAHRFPTVYGACMSAGIDPSTHPIPVAPAAHYHMGGIASDRHGRSSLPGLWVVGECASTGLHGANRLASNSLLEGLIFGARVAQDVRGQLAAGVMRGIPPAPPRFASPAPPHVLRSAMTRDVALERDDAGLRNALAVITRLQTASSEPALLNMAAAAKLVAAGALARRESRGGHWRNDFPQTAATATRTFMTLADADKIAEETMTNHRHAAR
ncbi:MAG TPA: FAD-binding protein, partial [Rhizomicrobium sp.]|nr:FAD-binding protein [Rhizomicrobium sp.]